MAKTDNPKVEALRDRVAASNNDYELARESGLERSWITRFRAAAITEPTVTRYDALKKALDRMDRRKGS